MLAKTGEILDLVEDINLPEPTAFMAFQARCADALMAVIKQQTDQGRGNQFVARIQEKDFLMFEAWQTIAHLNGCSVLVTETNAIHDSNGTIIAYESWASVVEKKTGQVVGRGNMECGMDSFPTRGKEGRDKDKSAKSASQTWAGSKACRMAFSFVAVLAGYEPTPADEMRTLDTPRSTSTSAVVDVNVHAWLRNCPIHDDPWRQSKNQREPAHRYNDGWCNQGATLDPLLNNRLEDVTAQLQWEKRDISPWLKQNYGNTWSRLSPSIKLDVLANLDQVLALDLQGRDSAATDPDEDYEIQDNDQGDTMVDEQTGEILEPVMDGMSTEKDLH